MEFKSGFVKIDVLIEQGSQLLPLEIKCGATITSEHFKNLRFWQNLTGQEKSLWVYGGDEQQTRSPNIEFNSWRRLPNL